MADGPGVVVDREGPVLVARIDRPASHNALDLLAAGALGRALLDADADPDVRALVVTGTGERTFSSGMDLAAFAGRAAPAGDVDGEGLERFSSFLGGTSGAVPVIGAANGSAFAGGFELLLACDMVVAADDARFGLPEVKRGLFAAGGGMLLGTRAPLAVALELVLTGDPVTAAEAHRLGLVNRVVAPGRVRAEAMDLATRVAANAPLAVRASKELVRLGATVSPDELRRVQGERRDEVFSSEDATEGVVAFIEKRDPVWRGR